MAPRSPKHLLASKREAILAVDLYNGSYERRSLEAFIVHMNIAWLYLLHAECIRDGIDIRYRRSAHRLEYVDGDVKLWDLSRCARERWSENDPVRLVSIWVPTQGCGRNSASGPRGKQTTRPIRTRDTVSGTNRMATTSTQMPG